MIGAKVVLDSISEHGDRLTTVEATIWRPLAAELMTHRIKSRNGASNRAIPLVTSQSTGTMDKVRNDPAFPEVWVSEKPGMVGGTVLEGSDLTDAQELFSDLHRTTIDRIQGYLDSHTDKSSRLHKSLINRLLEPFAWQTYLLSATSWDNFFYLRCSPQAQHEFRLTAEAIQAAIEASTPQPILDLSWHMPFIQSEDWSWADTFGSLRYSILDTLKRISAARCARISYLTHEGKRDQTKDLELCDSLIRDQHASPLEHIATPDPENKQNVNLTKLFRRHPKGLDLPRVGNFYGWTQFRHEVMA